MQKIEGYGIQGNLLRWFRNYLQNRKQAVQVGDALSDFNNENAGVPQGLVLGSLLFLVYINEIADNLLSIFRLFADTSLAYSSGNLRETGHALNRDLTTLYAYTPSAIKH